MSPCTEVWRMSCFSASIILKVGPAVSRHCQPEPEHAVAGWDPKTRRGEGTANAWGGEFSKRQELFFSFSVWSCCVVVLQANWRDPLCLVLGSSGASSKSSWSCSSSRPYKWPSNPRPSWLVGEVWPSSQPPSLCWRSKGKKPSRWSSAKSSSLSSIPLWLSRPAPRPELYAFFYVTWASIPV